MVRDIECSRHLMISTRKWVEGHSKKFQLLEVKVIGITLYFEKVLDRSIDIMSCLLWIALLTYGF